MNKTDSIIAYLKEEIFTGNLRCGDRIPSEYNLARRFNVNKTTANKAVAILVTEGLLERGSRGAGTMVKVKGPFRGHIMFIGSVKHFYYAQIINGAQRTAIMRNYLMTLSAPRPEGLSEFIQRISQTETLGVLTSNYGRLLIPDGIPLIHIDREFEVDVCPRYVVNSNGAQGITDLVNEFLEKGHRELAMIYSELPSSRVSSFIDVLQKAGISNAEKRIFCCPEKEKFSFHLLDTMFSHFPNLTGIITASDDLAFNVILNLRNRGIRVPEEISVAGFGNLPHICSLFDLTSVEQHGFEIGAFCANRLIDMIEKKYEAESFNELLPCELVRRQSIQPVRTVV